MYYFAAFFHGTKPVDRLVQIRQGLKPESHCALLKIEHEVRFETVKVEPIIKIAHAVLNKGVILQTAGRYGTPPTSALLNHGVWMDVCFLGQGVAASDAWGFYVQELTKPYDLIGALGLCFKRPHVHLPSAWYCSEILATALNKCPLPGAPNYPERAFPCQLRKEMGKFYEFKRMVLRSDKVIDHPVLTNMIP
jgi:hypothetical protein